MKDIEKKNINIETFCKSCGSRMKISSVETRYDSTTGGTRRFVGLFCPRRKWWMLGLSNHGCASYEEISDGRFKPLWSLLGFLWNDQSSLGTGK